MCLRSTEFQLSLDSTARGRPLPPPPPPGGGDGTPWAPLANLSILMYLGSDPFPRRPQSHAAAHGLDMVVVADPAAAATAAQPRACLSFLGKNTEL